jgi:hypothetical protein
MNRHALFSGIVALALLLFAVPAPAQQGTSQFDHFKTGFPLTGGHAFVDCVSCHIQGRLAGTPRACAACHNGSMAPGMPSNHIPSWVPTCDSCHRNTVSWSGTRMNHAGIISGCTSCHYGQAFYGVTPVSKSANHMATTPANQDCIACHRSYVSFLGATFDHTGITSGCATCHNGTAALGKGTNHIATSGDCVTCHSSFASFATYSMSHTAVTGTCASCHGGQTFQNITPVTRASNHLPTTLDCGTCHLSTTLFGPGTAMNHTGITSGCATCHNGQVFQGVTPVSKPGTHIVTTADCATCHTSFTSFLGATFSHTGVAAGTCYSCHGVPTSGAMMENAGHVATGSSSCDICHKSTAVGGFATFTMGNAGHAATVPVTLLSSNCMTCHNGSVFGTKTFKPHPGKNGATASTANFCGNCHKSFTSDPGGG